VGRPVRSDDPHDIRNSDSGGRPHPGHDRWPGRLCRVRNRDSRLFPLVASPHSEYSPVVSPDGKWLAYVSNESGRYEVYVTPLAAPTGAKWAISTAGGSAPRWSHRGNELFYLDAQSNLVSTQLTTTPSVAVQNTRVLFNASDFVQTSVSRRNYDVAADDQRFLMVQRAEGATRGQVVVVEHWADEIRRKPRN